jgi:carbon monoxide dehydrogenase subunit G
MRVDKSKLRTAQGLAACVRKLPMTFCAIAGFAVGPASAKPISAVDAAWLMTKEPAVSVVAAASPADGEVNGSIEIPAPPAAVWNVLYDCARAPAIMPNLTKCAVVESGAAWDVREHRVRWISLLPEITSRFRSAYVANVSISFQLAGGDLNALDGEWRLTPLLGGAATRLTYRARVGFGALIPSFVIRNSMQADIPNFLKAIRNEAVRSAGMEIAAPAR